MYKKCFGYNEQNTKILLSENFNILHQNYDFSLKYSAGNF